MNTVALDRSPATSRTRITGEASTHLPVSEDQLGLRRTPTSFPSSGSSSPASTLLKFVPCVSAPRVTTLHPSVSHRVRSDLGPFFAGTADGAAAARFLQDDEPSSSGGSICVTWCRTSEKDPSRTTSRRRGEGTPMAARMSSQRRSAFRESPPLNRKLDRSSMDASAGRPNVS